MMVYHPIKFDCKRIGSSVVAEKVIVDFMSSHYDLDLEDSKPIFSHDTLAHCITISNLVTKGSAVQKYPPDRH